MHTLVILRHGESTWNKENRFTGWTDVDLSEKGREEALAAGQLLKEEGYLFDVAYTPANSIPLLPSPPTPPGPTNCFGSNFAGCNDLGRGRTVLFTAKSHF